MDAYELAKDSVKIHEGLRLNPYRCTAGKLTIGYGHNIEDNGISNDVADYILDEDLRASAREATYAIDNFHELNEHRQAVLIEMAFALGLPRLRGFVKMIKAVSQHDYQEAAEELLDSKWAREVGKRALVLSEKMREGA